MCNNLTALSEIVPGDCNGDGETDSDHLAIVDAIFNGTLYPVGCDANLSGSVDAGDIVAIGLLRSGLGPNHFLPSYASVMVGDCNADALLDSEDLESLVAEILDGDGVLTMDIDQNLPISGYGCDADRDGLVNSDEITCLDSLIAGGNCS